MTRRSVLALGALCMSGTVLWAQDAASDRIVVPFRDANRPRQVRAKLINGGITVHGYDGKDVIVETQTQSGRDRRVPRRAEGLHRIDIGGGSLNIEEDNNTITIGARGVENNTNLVIQVPVNTSLYLRTINGGDITVERVSGELDIDNTNGRVILHNVAGSVTAHALNGEIQATVDRVTPDKPMSFSSLNGDIDVTFPPDIRARFKMKADNGEVFSDFDVKLEPNASAPTVEDNRGKNGKYRVKVDRTTVGTVNGGGPEIQFTTFNGKIMIRKRK